MPKPGAVAAVVDADVDVGLVMGVPEAVWARASSIAGVRGAVVEVVAGTGVAFGTRGGNCTGMRGADGRTGMGGLSSSSREMTFSRATSAVIV